MHESSSDESRLIMNKEHQKRCQEQENIKIRERLFSIYQKAFDDCNKYITNKTVFSIFFGYINSDEIVDIVIELIYNQDSFLDEKIRFILNSKIKNNEELRTILLNKNFSV